MPSIAAFFASPAAVPVRGRPVTYRIIRNDGELIAVDARSLLMFVDETERAAAHREADASINSRLKPGENATETAREDERIFHVLFRALRIEEPPHTAQFRTVDELRGCLVLPVVQELWAEYQRFLVEEFPAYVDPAEFAKLVEAAKTRSFLALPEGFDSDTVRRSLPSLVKLLWK